MGDAAPGLKYSQWVFLQFISYFRNSLRSDLTDLLVPDDAVEGVDSPRPLSALEGF